MPAAWPETVPYDAIFGSFKEQPHRNVATFEPDSGVAIERRRSSLHVRSLSFNSLVTRSAKADLDAFYSDTLADGVLPFTRKHPRTGETITCKFTAAPDYTDAAPGKFIVSLAFVRMP